MKDKDKCGIAHCRADSDITLPDGTGLCWNHWNDRCEEKDKDAQNQSEKGKEQQAQAGSNPNI